MFQKSLELGEAFGRVSDRLTAMIPVTLGSEGKFGWRPEGSGNLLSR